MLSKLYTKSADGRKDFVAMSLSGGAWLFMKIVFTAIRSSKWATTFRVLHLAANHEATDRG